jgi:hypothetical protein
MKREEQKKIEVLIKNKRVFLSEKAAKIAINHLGGTEVTQFARPLEVGTKPLPPIIAANPVPLITKEPVIEKPKEVKTTTTPKAKVEPDVIQAKTEPKATRTKKTKK